ncbi:MAG TPA: hypothetical protein VML96_06680 [Egibacteraceae bacterium]|nr:hypothetical protein [Egibacteraceae bacterium]
MQVLLGAAERVPNWVRAALAIGLPVVAFLTAAARSPVMIAVFLAWSALTLMAHAPVFAFDGPLPFSSAGLHAAGRVHEWSHVIAVEPLGDKDLCAVLADGQRVRLRVRGRRTREQLREALARHKPEAVRF